MGSMGIGTLLLNIVFFLIVIAIVVGLVSYFRTRSSRSGSGRRTDDVESRRQ